MADLTKQRICDMLRAHVNQRSGISARDYFDDWRDASGRAAFASDRYTIARDGRDARALLAWVEGRDGITADDLRSALSRAFSGRLSLVEPKQPFGAPVAKSEGGAERYDNRARLDYCTGQYFCTEYRAAACAVLAAAIWRYLADSYPAEGAERVRKEARGYFGRGLASRWFN